jgi:hypothetical protein
MLKALPCQPLGHDADDLIRPDHMHMCTVLLDACLSVMNGQCQVTVSQPTQRVTASVTHPPTAAAPAAAGSLLLLLLLGVL